MGDPLFYYVADPWEAPDDLWLDDGDDEETKALIEEERAAIQAAFIAEGRPGCKCSTVGYSMCPVHF